MEETKAKFGLSRKTNVAMTSAGCFAAVGSVGSAADWRIGMAAIIAAFIVAIVSITYQYRLDRKNQNEKIA